MYCPDFDTQTCPICGKRFIPAVEHIYHLPKKKTLVCTYTCQRTAEKKEKQKK